MTSKSTRKSLDTLLETSENQDEASTLLLGNEGNNANNHNVERDSYKQQNEPETSKKTGEMDDGSNLPKEQIGNISRNFNTEEKSDPRTISSISAHHTDKLSLRFSKETEDYEEQRGLARKDSRSTKIAIDQDEKISLKSHSSSKSKVSSDNATKSRKSFSSLHKFSNSAGENHQTPTKPGPFATPRLSLITLLNNIVAPARNEDSTINISTTPRQSASHPQIYYKDSTHQSRSTTTSHAKSETSKICFKDLSQEELKSESDYVDLEALADDSNMDKSIHYRDCHICFHLQPLSNFALLTNCIHRVCKICLLKYLSVEIMESRTNISCPECSEAIDPVDIHNFLSHRHSFLLERYEWFSLRRCLFADPEVRWCPAPDCNYAVVAPGCASCPHLQCQRPGCGTSFCYLCKNYWHGGLSCEQAAERVFRGIMSGDGRNDADPRLPSSSSSVNASTQTGAGAKRFDAIEALGIDPKSADGEIKCCPRCSALIVKLNDGSCNHMSCAICGAEFCWLCLKQINELHYLSPTGCTFWGKRRWSRKKKLLWQIGTLIGAPVGIALIAGLAIPGIIIGVPIFVGRKIYQRFSNLNRARRNVITALSVAGSLLVSPVLAIMAVGVGVPIMLAYVYGVVPLSLCRNGACGGGSDASLSDEDDSGGYEDITDNNGHEEQLDLLTASRRRTASDRNRRRSRTHMQSDAEKGSSQSIQAGAGTSKHRLASALIQDSGGASAKVKIVTKRPIDRSTTSSPLHPGHEGSIGSGELSIQQHHNRGKSNNRRRSSPSVPSSMKSGSIAGVCVEKVQNANRKTQVQQQQGIGVQQHHTNHQRRESNESSGITSLGAVNTEDASIRAIAGSQYACDTRSVYTLGRAADLEAVSYNEETASTIACCGGIPERRSLSGGLSAGGSFKAISASIINVPSNQQPMRPRSSISNSPPMQQNPSFAGVSSYSCNLSANAVVVDPNEAASTSRMNASYLPASYQQNIVEVAEHHGIENAQIQSSPKSITAIRNFFGHILPRRNK